MAEEIEGQATVDAPEALAAPPDLVSTLSEILAENTRLERLSQELKPASAQDDEFGRFARKAIPIVDALDRIVELGKEHGESEEMRGWFESVESLYDRVLRTLEAHDLHVMQCLGQPVDFGLHDVIELRRTREYPHHTVIQEIRKGIVFRDRVLRDAKVVVALNEDEE